MSNPARTAAASHTQFICSERPFSNFNHCDSLFAKNAPLRRILSQARMRGYKTMIIEHIPEADDLQEENEDIKSLRPDFDPKTQSESFRLSFFSTAIRPDCPEEITQASFLGYAICKLDDIPPAPNSVGTLQRCARVYESVIRPSRHDNNFIHSPPEWSCRVCGREMKIKGYIYAEQNRLTNSCAHVAVRTTATQFLKKDLSYRKIRQWVAEYRANSGIPLTPPKDGLTNGDMCYALKKAGANTYMGDYRRDKPPVPYWQYLYGSVESGFPGIVFFTTEGNNSRSAHAITVFGHTFNEDTWVPDADSMYFQLQKVTKSLSSSTWVSMFIGHDDNAGSNYCIPQSYIEPYRACIDHDGKPIQCRQQGGSVAYAIGTMPETVKLDPIAAEAIGAEYLFAVLREVPGSFSGWNNYWQDRLANVLNSGEETHPRDRLVLRTRLVSSHSYAEHLTKIRGWDESKRIDDWVPNLFSDYEEDYFWMIEFSFPELFSANRRKLGEILVRADDDVDPERRLGSFLFARLPGCLAQLSQTEQGQENFEYFEVCVDDHVEILGCEEHV